MHEHLTERINQKRFQRSYLILFKFAPNFILIISDNFQKYFNQYSQHLHRQIKTNCIKLSNNSSTILPIFPYKILTKKLFKQLFEKKKCMLNACSLSENKILIIESNGS